MVGDSIGAKRSDMQTMTGAKITILAISALICRAQQLLPTPWGAVSGVLRGSDGSALSGASLTLTRTAASTGKAQRSRWTARSGDQGAFAFERLPEGQYTLCAQVPQDSWINPCEWGLQPTMVTISRGHRSAGVLVELAKGAAVQVRISDPKALLAQHDGKAGSHLLVGVSGDSSVFHPASVVSQDVAGRSYQIVVPSGLPIRLIVSSSFFQLSDGAGIALARIGSTSIPLTVTAGQSVHPISLTVTGGGK
jgi:hypothetical protein